MPVFSAIAAVAAIVTSVGSAVAGAVGLGAVVTGVGATALGGAVIGACIGGTVAAVKGENILKGALGGGLIGAAAGGLLGWGAEAIAAKGLAGSGAAAVEGAGMSTQTAGSFMGLEQGVSGLGMTTVAEGGTIAGKAGLGKLGGFWAGLSGSDKTLLLATGAEFVSGAMGPDEEELLERKAQLEREAMRVSGIGDIDDFRAKVDWKKFEQPAFERSATNRFKDFNRSLTPDLFTSNAGPTDANIYRIAPKPGSSPAPTAPKPQPGAQQSQAASGPATAPKPQSMLGQ